ncbi:MAG: hypothetical protein H8E89_02450 [Candidatus Nitrosopelagicus sp.]|nr:hypothetical protein [Candidatus Nitrosopelagicus sp.]
MVKASAFVIYILPIVLSVSLGTAVMAETLGSSDRELNFLQFGGEGYTSSSKTGINLVGFDTEIIQNTNLEFTIKVINSDFNCGDLYITIFDVSTSEKQVLTQSGYLKQCYIQNNNLLPVGENYSELISEPGIYEIFIEIFNEKYSENISMTKTLRVK